MNFSRHGAVLWAVAVVFLLGGGGCVTTKESSAHRDGAAATLGVLDPEQQQFSQALAHYVTGLLCLSQGETNDALAEWEQVVALDPTRKDLREKIVQEYFRRGDFKKAAEVLQVAAQQDPSSVMDWMLLAVAYRADKQWELATHAAEKAIHLDPLKFPSYEVLFDVAIEHQNLAQARQVLERAARHDSKDSQFWVRLADLNRALAEREPALGVDMKKVVEFYDKAMALQPKDTPTLVRIADFYVMNQHLEKAIALYQKILDTEPNAENVRLKLAFGHVAQGDKKNAIAILAEVVKREPLRYQVLTLLGELYEDSHEYDKALQHYRLSLSVNPSQLPPHLKIVLLQLRQKQFKEALAQLDQATEKFPNTPQIAYFYGLAYSENKEHVRAIEFFEQAVRLAATSAPDLLDPVFHFYYGAALERAGRFEQAVEQFRKAIETNPDYADACNYLGFMFADRKMNLEEALQLIEKAVAMEPNNGAFLDSLGWIYFRLGRLDEALLQLQRAAKIVAAGDPTILDHIGDVYRQMGRNIEALQYYQKAVELDPKNDDILGKIESIQQALSSNHPTPQPSGTH